MFITGIHLLNDSFPTRDHYPFNLEILNKTDSVRFSQPVSFFIGENGTGKTTLLKAIARHCSIHIWEDADRRRYHHNRYEDDLARYIRVDTKDGESGGLFSLQRSSGTLQRSWMSGQLQTRQPWTISGVHPL